MNLKQAVESNIKKYATFTGRSARSEYWYWVLFCIIIGFIAGILDAMLFMSSTPQPGEAPFQPLTMICSLATLIPSIAVGARRLHDIDKSGWWMLIALTGIGAFLLLYWDCKRGTAGDNRFGPDPLSGTVA